MIIFLGMTMIYYYGNAYLCLIILAFLHIDKGLVNTEKSPVTLL